MSYRVEFLGIAEEELEDAVQWYADQKDNLSASFVEAIDILLSYVIENPLLFPTRGSYRIRVKSSHKSCLSLVTNENLIQEVQSFRL